MVEYRPSKVVGNVTVDGVALSSSKAVGAVSAVPATTLTTIVTKTADANLTNISLVSVSGDDYAKYTLVINTVIIDTRRTGPARNLTFDFTSNPLKTSVGDVIDIKVEHFFSGDTLDFEATIYGYA
jgi:hypothetical protein